MDSLQKSSNPSSDSHADFQTRMGFWKEFEETNENEGCSQIPFTVISASSKKKKKKKILAERNVVDDLSLNSPNTQLGKTLKQRAIVDFGNISDSKCSLPYDPVNNYMSPRPAFLRYNPDRRREILWRMKNEEDSDDREDSMSVFSISPSHSFHHEETQEDAEDILNTEVGNEEEKEEEEEKVEERRPWCSRMVWKLLLLSGILLLSCHFLFPMSSTTSPLQERLNFSSSRNSLYGKLLKTHMGLSDMCFDIGQSMCEIEGSETKLAALESIKLSKIQNPLYGILSKTHMGLSDMCLDIGERMCGIDDSLKGHIGYSEVDRVLALDDELESVTGDEAGMDELVIKEKREEPLSAHEFFELQEESGPREESGDNDEEIMGTESNEKLTTTATSFQSVEASDEQFISDDSYTHQEDLTETSSRFEFASKDKQLLIISTSLLTVMTGLLCVLFKYIANSHHKALPIAKRRAAKRVSKGPNAKHLYANHSPPAVSVIKELIDEVKIVNVKPNPLPSNHSSDGFQEFYATRQPVVELLGEFSLSSNDASVRTLKSKGYEESEFPKSRVSFQSERSRVVKVNSSPIKAHPVESTSNGSYTSKEQREVTGEKSETKKVVDTPLRRSSRLQNRVTSSPTSSLR